MIKKENLKKIPLLIKPVVNGKIAILQKELLILPDLFAKHLTSTLTT